MKNTRWIYSDLRPVENCYLIEDEEDTRGIATVHGTEANAQLIAAAPEMLEALKDIKHRLAGYLGESETVMSTDYEALENAEKLIAKAEGGVRLTDSPPYEVYDEDLSGE